MSNLEILKEGHGKKERNKIPEKYLEAIYEITVVKDNVRPIDIARILNVKPSTVKKVISGLVKKGYVNYVPYKQLLLTKTGKKYVLKLKERHTTLAKFFQLVGLDKKISEVEAERIEHLLSDKTTILFKTLVNFLLENEEIRRKIEKYVKDEVQ